MARYIDVDRSIHNLKKALDDTSLGIVENFFNSIIKYFETAPTADVVEVVRCKECKHHTSIGTCDCPQWLFDDVRINVKPTDFCSYGERSDT